MFVGFGFVSLFYVSSHPPKTSWPTLSDFPSRSREDPKVQYFDLTEFAPEVIVYIYESTPIYIWNSHIGTWYDNDVRIGDNLQNTFLMRACFANIQLIAMWYTKLY